MGVLKSLFNFHRAVSVHDLKRYVFYKIVDSAEEEYEYLLQCINTKAIFRAKMGDVISDIDLLHGLHPVQSCYVGIEYAKYLKSAHCQQPIQSRKKTAPYLSNRYGNCQLLYEQRKGNIGFYDQRTDRTYLMDSRDVALSQELIQEFDAAQAFYIGVSAGMKLHNSAHRSLPPTRPQLRLVD